MDFHDSFNFLCNHPYFNNNFMKCLDVMVFKVDPETNLSDEKDESKNTKTRVWVSSGAFYYEDSDNRIDSVDLDLFCGGDTFEEAIIKMAEVVEKKHGRY